MGKNYVMPKCIVAIDISTWPDIDLSRGVAQYLNPNKKHGPEGERLDYWWPKFPGAVVYDGRGQEADAGWIRQQMKQHGAHGVVELGWTRVSDEDPTHMDDYAALSSSITDWNIRYQAGDDHMREVLRSFRKRSVHDISPSRVRLQPVAWDTDLRAHVKADVLVRDPIWLERASRPADPYSGWRPPYRLPRLLATHLYQHFHLPTREAP